MKNRLGMLLFFLAMSAISFAQAEQSLTDSTANVQMTTKQKDSLAKSLAPIDEKAIVYILRPTSYGAIVKMDVDCDSVHIGSTMADKYVYTVVSPGTHTFVSKAENHGNLTLTAEAGKVYYIKQQVKMGFVFAETSLKLIDEAEGKKSLGKCKLSKDNVYTN